MSNIVVEPQPDKVPTTSTAGEPPVKVEPTAKPVDPLASLTVPSDLDGVDPTYRGKSVRDIIEMHQNASRKIGENANEIGVWRKLVSQLSAAQASSPSAQVPAAKPVEITNEELLGDPTKAISSVVQSAIKAELGPIKEQLGAQAVRTEFAELAREFPNMVEVGNDPKFQEWVSKSRTRSEDAEAVKGGDVRSARRLLESWGELQLARQAAAQTSATVTAPAPQTVSRSTGIEAARKAVTETGGHGAAAAGETLSSADIVNMIINDPEKYRSTAYQEKLKAAAKEGRISF